VTGTWRVLALLAAVLAAIWVGAAAIGAVVLHGHQVERGATYQGADASKSFEAQGRPAFVALTGQVARPGSLLRERNQSEATWYLPLGAADRSTLLDVHWLVRYEGRSLPSIEWPLLARNSSNNPPQVVRDAFERANVHLSADAVVVELVPSSGGVPINRDADTIEFAVGVASLLSVMVMFGSILLAVLNVRAARRQKVSGRRPAGRSTS